MEVFSFFKVWHSLKGVSLKASRADYILDCVSNHPSPPGLVGPQTSSQNKLDITVAGFIIIFFFLLEKEEGINDTNFCNGKKKRKKCISETAAE